MKAAHVNKIPSRPKRVLNHQWAVELNQAINVLEKNKKLLGFEKIISNDGVVKVSVVGVGMRSHPGVAQKMFSTLGKNGINIHVISTSEIKVSVLIDEEYTELAVRSLHTVYGLDDNK